MNPYVRIALGALALGTVAVGCSSSRTAVADDADAHALLARLVESYAATPALNITGTMKISGVPATIWFDALARGRDSLKIGLTGPFGIPVGAMCATPGAFVFFNAQEGTAYEGEPSRTTFAKLMAIDMDYDQMVSMIRGELPRIPTAGEYTAELLDGNVRYTVSRGSSTEMFTVDPTTLAAVDYRRWHRSADNEVTELSIRFRDYMRIGQRTLPRRANVEINDAEQKLTIEVDKAVDTIADDRSLAVELPPGTPRKRI